MDYLKILLKTISLICRDRKEDNKLSLNLTRDIIKLVRKKKRKKDYHGGESDVVEDLLSMLEKFTELSVSGVVNRLSLIDELESLNEDNLHSIDFTLKNLKLEVTLDENEQYVNALQVEIKQFINDVKTEDFIYQLQFKYKDGRSQGLSKKQIMEEFREKLNEMDTDDTDESAIVSNIDFDKPETMTEDVKKMKESVTNKSGFRTPWKALNRALCGSIPRGTYTVVGALKHNYKTGLVMSLMLSALLLDGPQPVKKEGLKPLVSLVSLEDDFRDSLYFIYKFIYQLEHNKLPDLKNLTLEEIQSHIVTKLKSKGFHVRFIRAKPKEMDINKLLKIYRGYIKEGYEIQMAICDYVHLLPTTFIPHNGIAGSDTLGMANVIRNFAGEHDIAFITPHQLNSQAGGLLKNGVPGTELVEMVRGKDYHMHCNSLATEMDIELYCHKCFFNGKPYLNIGRGKMKGTDIIDEKHLNFYLPFSTKGPIMPDLDGPEITFDPNSGGDDDFGSVF